MTNTKAVLLIIWGLIFLFSCKNTGRDFFKNVQSKNMFIDSFKMENLNGFGIDAKPTKKGAITYYQFNAAKNSIRPNGYFRKSQSKIFFLPENCEKELVFADTSFWSTSMDKFENFAETKDKSKYKVGVLNSNDSLLFVAMTSTNIFNNNQTLIFELDKRWLINRINFINCKNDTLVIEFYPKQKVFYKYINANTICL